jgi:hypothetical protein
MPVPRETAFSTGCYGCGAVAVGVCLNDLHRSSAIPTQSLFVGLRQVRGDKRRVPLLLNGITNAAATLNMPAEASSRMLLTRTSCRRKTFAWLKYDRPVPAKRSRGRESVHDTSAGSHLPG